MRLWVLFSKEGPARYISHLDVQRTFERAFRRAQVPVAYSQGFNPHPRFSIASALMLGAAGEREVLDVHLEKRVEPSGFVASMNSVLPPGLPFRAAREVMETEKDAPALVRATRYRVVLEEPCGWLVPSVQAFCDASSVRFLQRRKDGVREIDARKSVLDMKITGQCELEFTLDVSSATLRPAEVIGLLSSGQPDASYTRTDILTGVGERLLSLFDYPSFQRP